MHMESIYNRKLLQNNLSYLTITREACNSHNGTLEMKVTYSTHLWPNLYVDSPIDLFQLMHFLVKGIHRKKFIYLCYALRYITAATA